MHRRILLVDDEASVHTTFQLFAGSLGHRIDYAFTVEQACKFAAENLYDIFFVDYRLDPGTALDLIKRLRPVRAYKTTPIVVISGYQGDDPMIKKLLGVGATYFLPKDRMSTSSIKRQIDFACANHDRLQDEIRLNRRKVAEENTHYAGIIARIVAFVILLLLLKGCLHR